MYISTSVELTWSLELGLFIGLKINERLLLCAFPVTVKVFFTIWTLVCLFKLKNKTAAYAVNSANRLVGMKLSRWCINY